MKSKRILVTGANGQMGQAFQRLSLSLKNLEWVFLGKDSLPIEQSRVVENYLSLVDFDYCINCAAYTAVDLAETEREVAMNINAHAAGYLMEVCARRKIRLIHFSTDYVFDGKKNTPYRTDDKTNPVNYYGLTKLEGERAIMQSGGENVIIRTSWLCSVWGKNFVKTMLRLMKEKEEIKVVNDQHGCPTFASDLAQAVGDIIIAENFTPGVFHFSNEGPTTWFDFATAIRDEAGYACKVMPIPTEAYPTPAKRPQYSVLDIEKIRNVYGVATPAWQASMGRCVAELVK